MASSTHKGQGMKSTVLKIQKLDGPETQKVKDKQKNTLQQNSALSEQLWKQEVDRSCHRDPDWRKGH